ncbi:MAG TPA: DUF192 domain-containing protein [Alphaproteobacteria bacterium]|nr:DUF192 domain-containing protein [Alphaproteobacteria bacterium]
MHKPFLYILILLLLALASTQLLDVPVGGAGDDRLGAGTLQIETGDGSHAFKIEMAVTAEERARGLMGRRTMGADEGMLFDYGTEQPVSFWMKNTYIALDMLFIRASGEIVHIAKRTIPESLVPVPSPEPVRAVLEVNAGVTDQLGIIPGDTVVHPIFGNAD